MRHLIDPADFTLEVRDDGCGFTPAQGEATLAHQVGLHIMQERAARIHAREGRQRHVPHRALVGGHQVAMGIADGHLIDGGVYGQRLGGVIGAPAVMGLGGME